MVAAKELLSRMKEDGWSLNEENVESILEGTNYNLHQAQNEILNCDLKEVGSPCLPDLQKGKGSSISSPVVLQVAKVRNISAPKAFEESGSAPRLLRVTLTDGFSTIHALEMKNIKPISLKTAPGTKVRLIGSVTINSGFILLYPSNVSVIGGTVQELFDKWKLSSSVSKFNRIVRATDGSGPPLWVPFGKLIEKKNLEEMRHFKALKDAEGKDKDNDDFENQRKQAVKELAKEGQGKVFGGGKQMLDANVQKVINAGFSQDVAEWALRNNKNDPVKAIRELKIAAGGQAPPDEGNYYTRNNDDEGYGGRGRGGGRGGRGRGRGRGRGGSAIAGPDGSDDDSEPPPNMPRPSGPASIFDFLDSKMIEKKETVKFVEPIPDVRGPTYQRGRGSGRGPRGKRGNFRNDDRHSGFNGSISPPNLTAENWPAPGEEKAPPSNRSYIESKELMDEKEHQDNMSRPPPRIAPLGGREYHQAPAHRNGYNAQQGYNRDNSDMRDGGGRQDYSNNQRDNYYYDARGRGGDRGGRRGFRGGGAGGYGGSYGGNYRGDADGGNYRYNDAGRGGGRGGGNSGPRRDGGYNNSYQRGDYSSQRGDYSSQRGDYSSQRGDYNTSNSGYRGNEGSNGYRSDYNPNSNKEAGYRGSNNHNDSNQYDSRYNYYDNRQRNSRGRMETGNRGNTQDHNKRQTDLIKDFQNSLTVSGHYETLPDGSAAVNSRYNDADYSRFSGTLEFHRSGGRRGGRGGYN